jgi:hypothetical protein
MGNKYSSEFFLKGQSQRYDHGTVALGCLIQFPNSVLFTQFAFLNRCAENEETVFCWGYRPHSSMRRRSYTSEKAVHNFPIAYRLMLNGV